jgi:hypothetical protein
MAERTPVSREIEIVRQLIESVRARQAQDPIVLAEAQERGFGVLMALEAQLQRAQRGQRAPRDATDSPVVAPGVDAERQDLMDAIGELSAALSELRDLASPAGPSRVGYGFVLPGRRVGRAGRPTRA